jgi:NADPH-dependent glutamate synthase beta subunit-like oxidoreductase
MPALQEEIDSAIEEGVKLETLISPLRVRSQKGKLTGVDVVKNRLGELDASGRRNPVPIAGSEISMQFDTLIVTIGDVPDIDFMSSMGIDITDKGTIKYDNDTLRTSRDGVFAGGDVTTGPNTVVEAIAAGRKAAKMIERYLRGEVLKQPSAARLPTHYIEPSGLSEEELGKIRRAKPLTASMKDRKGSFVEVEMTLSENDAVREARRCLRCDLEFTQAKEIESVGGKVA